LKNEEKLKSVLLANGEVGDMRDLQKPAKRTGTELLEKIDKANEGT